MFSAGLRDIIRRVSRPTNTAAIATAGRLTIQFPTDLANKKVCVVNFAFDHTGGTGANHAGRWFDGATGSAAADGSIHQKFRSSSVVVATPITPALIVSGPAPSGMLVLLLDADARAYFDPNPDAGADNTYQWFVDYYPLYNNIEDTTN